MAHRDRSNHSNNNNNGQYSKISYKLLHDQNESNQPSDNKLGSECAVLLSHSSNEDDETIMKSSYNIDTRLFDMKHEYISAKSGSRVRKVLCVAFTMLVFLAIVGTAIYFFIGSSTTASPLTNQKPTITLDDTFIGSFYAPSSANASWISDNELLYRNEFLDILKYNVETKKKIALALGDNPVISRSKNYELSPDGKYLLLAHDETKIFRHSVIALYDVYNVETKEVRPLSDKHLIFATWGSVNSSLAYVLDNNIYYKATIDSDAIQLTLDGSESIYNGICDWVYEEEVFSQKRAIWFAPDGSQLAYAHFNDSEVNTFTYPLYGQPGQLQYPYQNQLPYPKTGSPNPVARLFSIDLKTLTPTNIERYEISAPTDVDPESTIISTVQWADNRTLLSSWMNRVQNQAHIQVCTDDKCRALMHLVSKTGWIDFYKAPLFNDNGTKFLYILPQLQSNNETYNHVTLVSMETGQQKALTKGIIAVTDILLWNNQANVVYFEATGEDAAQEKHVYLVAVNESDAQKPVCITCNITRNGRLQTHFGADFSSDGKHLILSNDGPSVPRIDIVRLQNGTLNYIQSWETNAQVEKRWANYSTPVIQYHRVPLDSGFDAIVQLSLPENLDTSGKTKYPMLVDVYAGPGSFAGEDRFDVGFGAYLVSNKSVIYARINARGSGRRSEKLLHTIYRGMGTVEVYDQIEAVKKLAQRFPFIDPKRVGIWGWSYGGFVAGMVLAKDNETVFKCSASVAPVTDWHLYDTIYTERYMGMPTPEDNADGYKRAWLSILPNEFKNKTYLLAHGTLDDNVHYQQSMHLIRALELYDIPFEQITYPDEDHSLGGVRRHLFHALDKYFGKCFEKTA